MTAVQAYSVDHDFPPAIERAMDRCREVFAGDYRRITFRTTHDPRLRADVLRLDLACETPDMLWLDWDYIVDSRPVVESGGLPYSFRGNGPMESLFYVNGACEMFRQVRREITHWKDGTLYRAMKRMHFQPFRNWNPKHLCYTMQNGAT